MGLKVKFL